MTKKLKTILLIDDDESTNFLHELVIHRENCAQEVVTVQSGRAALDYLASSNRGEHPQPDLILLDINMPAMNGWEFLEEYEKMDESLKGQMVIVMLTTSLNPDDKENAKTFKSISSFSNKPLTGEMLQEIIVKDFSDKEQIGIKNKSFKGLQYKFHIDVNANKLDLNLKKGENTIDYVVIDKVNGWGLIGKLNSTVYNNLL